MSSTLWHPDCAEYAGMSTQDKAKVHDMSSRELHLLQIDCLARLDTAAIAKLDDMFQKASEPTAFLPSTGVVFMGENVWNPIKIVELNKDLVPRKRLPGGQCKAHDFKPPAPVSPDRHWLTKIANTFLDADHQISRTLDLDNPPTLMDEPEFDDDGEEEPTKDAAIAFLINQKIMSDWHEARNMLKNRFGVNQCEVTAPATSELTSGRDGLFEVFLEAYNNHHALYLDPSDISLMISLVMAGYIESHAEELRDHFVHHEGKKLLVVEDGKQSDNWDGFLEGMGQAIRLSVKNPEFVSLMTSSDNLSTQTMAHAHLGLASVMHASKHYFEYGRRNALCGIPRVHLAGVEADYERLEQVLEGLKAFVAHPHMHRYLVNMQKIIRQFRHTLNGQVSSEFWTSMMDVYGKDGMSGQRFERFITGWIVVLFGKEGRVNPKDLELPIIDVDIKHVDNVNNTESNVKLMGGFYASSQLPDVGSRHKDGLVIRPAASYVIVRDNDSIRPQSAETIAKFDQSSKELAAKASA